MRGVRKKGRIRVVGALSLFKLQQAKGSQEEEERVNVLVPHGPQP